MPTARWNGVILAKTDTFERVEGNIYFPPESVQKNYLTASGTTTHCPWKGDASYYSITVDGQTLEDGAWYYPAPFEKASHIKDHIAFWKGVEVEE